jgi:hypothetical protein
VRTETFVPCAYFVRNESFLLVGVKYKEEHVEKDVKGLGEGMEAVN